MTGLRLLAVDDEGPALDDISRLLESSAGVASVDRASGGTDALRRLNEVEGSYDAIFLDVRMPDLDGAELTRVLDRFANAPAIVFVSAHPEAAVGAFELGVLDFLAKPVEGRRLEQALERVAGRRSANPGPDDDEIVPVDSLHGTKRLIARSSVLYLRAQGDYLRVVTDDSRFLMRGALSEIEERWRQHGFARVHRQYAVNLHRAEELRPRLNGTATLVFPGDRSVPVARRRIAELRRRLNF